MKQILIGVALALALASIAACTSTEAQRRELAYQQCETGDENACFRWAVLEESRSRTMAAFFWNNRATHLRDY